MKQIAIVGAVLVLLIGGWLFLREPEPAPEVVQTQPESATEPGEALPAVEEAVAENEAAPQMVEESAAEEVEVEDRPILLAQADTSSASPDWQFVDGTHFTRLVPTQPTIGGADKIEVAEIFWYGCAH